MAMLFHAKEGKIEIGNTDMNYITFGRGKKLLVMIPGLGDGLRMVKGYALPLAVMYRKYAKSYQVYVFSRKNHFSKGYDTRQMAGDLAEAMKRLKIERADIMGVSQGGMIAQYLAIDFPEMVNKLVLLVTLSRQNEVVQKVISNWIEKAERKDYMGLFIDMAEKSYSEKHLKWMRWLYPVLGRIGRPKDFTRFLIMADACVSHDSYEELEKIRCRTLVIGGTKDNIVTGAASKELAAGIADSQLYLYEGLGHGTHEEARDLDLRVLSFLEDR